MKEGEKPDFSVTQDNQYCTVNNNGKETVTYMVDGNTMMQSSWTFSSDHYYRVWVNLSGKVINGKQYVFPSNQKVYINGKSATLKTYGKTASAYCDFVPTGSSLTSHNISVTNGTATPSKAKTGETVTITYKSGHLMTFDHWEVVFGGVTLADASAKTTTFTMPNQDVSIKAVFKKIQVPLTFTTQPQSGTAKKGESYTFTWALTDTPDSIFIDRWMPSANDWGSSSSLAGLTSWSEPFRELFTDENVSKYRITATKGTETIHSNEFTVTWTEDAGELVNPFIDVYSSDIYYDAVLWAYYHNPFITNGVDATHFGPRDTVTRGQCAAFLWRAMGCPEPKSNYNPFNDVPEWQYYYKPVLWAVENGITKGTSANKFSPDQKLSTAHIITFLYRTKNKGKDGWYEEAKAWATKGYGSDQPFGVTMLVSPEMNCERAWVVYFLQKSK